MPKRKSPFNLATAPRAVTEAAADSNFRVFTNVDEDENTAELLIYEQIGEDWYGEGVTASGVVSFLRDNADREINVRINSPGGLVYDGLVIFNALTSHQKQVTVTIEGLAYSAASFIAMAGDVVKMHKASDIGIHRASIIAWGNQKEMRSMVEWLSVIDEHLVDIYEGKTGKSREQIEAWLDGTSDGTVFSATEAKEQGFADEVIEQKSKTSKEKAEDAKKAVIKNVTKRAAARNKMRLEALRS